MDHRRYYVTSGSYKGTILNIGELVSYYQEGRSANIIPLNILQSSYS
ncbi:hypothetical protein [Methanobacterium ferruginis]|nr:hypothetical protein [Methanobacterium ferruginis]